MKKEMLINVMQPEECRIAIVEDGVLEELYVERTSQESYVGNIYKGRIVNIEPSIQAAFVDFGIGRNGFLHVSDVEPAYYRHLEMRRDFDSPRRGHRDRDRGGRRSGPGDDSGRRRRGPDRRGERNARPEQEIRDEPYGGRPVEPADVPLDSIPEVEPVRYGEERPERHTPGHDFGTPPEAASESPPPKTTEPEENPPPRERTRFMDSAERRTDKDHPRSQSLTSSSISDADLFFPREETPPAVREDVPPPELVPPEFVPEPVTFATPSPQSPPVYSERAIRDIEERSELSDDLNETLEELPPTRDDRDNAPEPEETEAPQGIMEDLDDIDEELPAGFEEEEDEDEGPRRHRRPPPRDGRRGRGFRRGPGRPGAGRPKPLIQDIFRRGQEVLVQVIKEGIGTKGPTLSTYISIAGRYLVLMPGLNRVGVSRKIIDEEARRRLRDVFHELQPPKGLGFIIRTAGVDKTKKELHRDLAYLARLWQVVVRRIRKLKAPAEIYQESDMITRTIRDTFTNDIDTIWVDEPAAFEHAQEFLTIVMPRYANRIKLFTDPEPLFYKYGIEDEISRIQQRHVPLPTGGSIVIDQTEALVAIDVNSGNFRADNNAEETAYQMNLQAAKEIARQLRLRDLGGVIVNDFIDMREEKHRRGVERAMREAVKRDRARTKILKISQFGLIEMTRQRIRPSLKRSIYQECPHCHSTGQVKTTESMSIDVMRMIQLAAHRPNIAQLKIRVAEEVANYLLNKKRKEIARLEETGEIQVAIAGQVGASPETLDFVCLDNNNNEIKFLTYEESKPRRR
jgi:ribonuclease E